MTPNAFKVSNRTTSIPLPHLVRNIWHHKSVAGEGLWLWITWAFTAYWMLFVGGAFLGHKELNAAGGVFILGVLAWALLERLWVRLDAVVMASLFAAFFLPLIQILVSSAAVPEALFKHVSLCLVIAIARVLELPAVFKSKMRWVLAVHVLAILFISMTIFKGTSWDGGSRHSGLFVNPNNLALIPFLLLFLVNPLKDKWAVHVGTHATVAGVLAFTGTSGAILAYAIGFVVHLCSMISKKARAVIYGLGAAGGVAAIAFLAVGGLRLLPESRLINQFAVMGDQMQTVFDGTPLDYYAQEKVLGSGSGSAIWRIEHWREVVMLYLDGTPGQQIFGFGIGGAVRIMGILPHNEYLRMLFEQGVLGLLLFLFVWYRIIMTAPPPVRYIGLIVALYSFSENNLDNFPFMALLVLFLSARGVGDAVDARIGRPLSALWNASHQQPAPSNAFERVGNRGLLLSPVDRKI
jgi:O-antigen ligase